MSGAPALPAVAERINAEHDQAHQAARSAIERAIECGRLLIEAKASVGHGDWLPWIEANLSFGPRQARNYMRIARQSAELEEANRQRDSDLTMREAVALLADNRQGDRDLAKAAVLEAEGNQLRAELDALEQRLDRAETVPECETVRDLAHDLMCRATDHRLRAGRELRRLVRWLRQRGHEVPAEIAAVDATS